MKKFTYLLSVSIVITMTIIFVSQSFAQNYDRSSFGYWQKKMEDPDQNYYELVEEFDNYWAKRDKTNIEGTGYKQFKRWEYAVAGMVGPDGKLLPLGYFSNEVNKFKQVYGDYEAKGNWQFVGPDIVPIHPPSLYRTGIGRLATLAFHPTNQNIIYVGAPSGGLWKTTTGGNSWENMNTDQLLNLGVSAILVHPDNPDIIFIGTGDKDGYCVPGQGIWKTIDGGISWTQVDSDMNDLLVSEILIQPDNHNMLLAAAGDGVYYSTDGGTNWEKAELISGSIKDISYKPGDPSIVYATGNGEFYRSVSYGTSWTRITQGLSPASRGAIGVTPANPDLVYFFTTKNKIFDGFYISLNSGLSFPTKIVSSEFDGNRQGDYNIAIAVDPNDPDIIFTGMVSVFKSTDGGYSWDKLPIAYNVHADQHKFKFSPFTNELYLANDGGLFKTGNLGNSFENLGDGLEITMVTRLAISETAPDIFIAGLQDNGTITPYNGQYNRILGGDGMMCAIDYTDDNYMYASSQKSYIQRSAEGGQYSKPLEIISDVISEDAGWLRPFVLDKDNPNIIFAGNKNVWRSSNVKSPNPDDITWTNISEGKINSDLCIEVMEQSMVDGNIIYISKHNGEYLYRTDNAYDIHPDWIEIPKPAGSKVMCFETHPYNPDIVYVIVGRNIYKSVDRGITWVPINENLLDIPLYGIVYHKGSDEGLFIGTLAGVFYKNAQMNNWVQYKSSLPLVPVKDMKIIYSTDPDQLVAGTWGRGIWKTDVLTDYRPNLTIPSGSVSVNDTQVEINLTVENMSSDVDASNFKLGYYLSVNNIITPSDINIGEDIIPYAAPGIIIPEDHSVDVSYIQPAIPSGTYYIGAFVDNSYQIDETDENDNDIVFSEQVTIPSPPLIPTNVAASDGAYGNKIVISWDEPSGASGTVWYRVFRNTYNNPNTAVELGSGPWSQETSYWDEDVEDGIYYYYWVKAAYNYLGLRSSAFSAYDKGYQYLSPPSNVEATNGVYDDKIKITWTPSENATHFKVWRNTSNNVNTATPLSATWSSAVYKFDYDVTQGTTYFYWVKAAMSSSGSRPSPYYSTSCTGYAALTDAPTAVATDGDFTDRIEITWNTVTGASYYMLFGSYTNDPENSNPMTAWITSTNHTDGGAQRGVYRYYWVKAATGNAGENATGYGLVDSGWRKLEPVQNVQATDGISTDNITITWDNQPYADYYKVYRSLNFYYKEPVSHWIDQTSFIDDNSVIPGEDYIYWITCANDTSLSSDFSDYDFGWRKLMAPEVDATDGYFNDHIKITWNDVEGAGSSMVCRGPQFSNEPTDTLSNWGFTPDFEYEDYDIVQGEVYRYFVQVAYNHYGYKPSDFGNDHGVADECANITEDPDPLFRQIDITGNILTINHRIINNGPHSTSEPFYVAYLLKDVNSGADMGMIGEDQIPAMDAGTFYDNTATINLETYDGGPLPHGTYRLTLVYNSTGNICETVSGDNVFIWDSPLVTYTDALCGTYTIGGTDPDYENFSDATNDLIDKGISGGVIFYVRPQIYYEQISLPNIIGSAPSKTILFRTESGHSDTAEINASGPDDYNYVIRFDGCRYITFDKIKITNPGYTNYQSTYGTCIEITNGSNNIKVENCSITGANGGEDPTTTDMAVVYCGNSYFNDFTLENNSFFNGSFSVFLLGDTSEDDESYNLYIQNNDIKNFKYRGIHLELINNVVIGQNYIYRSQTEAPHCYGVFMSNIEEGFVIEKNQIIVESDEGVTTGVMLWECYGTSENRALIANNFIAVNSDNEDIIIGLKTYGCKYTDIYYNSINLTGQLFQDTYSMYFYCADEEISYDNNVKNNIFKNEKNGYAVYFDEQAVNWNYITDMDFNDLYTTGSFIGEYGNSGQVIDLNTWKGITGFDLHSVSGDPLFISSSDLHAESWSVNDTAAPVSVVQLDIDGDARHPLFPDMGADEFTPPPPEYDIYVNNIIEPETGYGLSNQETVKIEIYNVGAQDVSNFPVSYRINGGNLITETVTDNVASFDVFWYSFATKADFSNLGDYVITSSTELPEDENSANDSFTDTITNIDPYNCVPLYNNTCSGGDYIDDFHFGTLYHNGTGCSQNGYGDYTNMTTYLTQGNSYQMDVSVGFGGQYVSLWIDFNDNLTFEQDEILVQDLYCENGGQTYSSNVDLPNSALPGPHRMRVRCAWDVFPVQPCKLYNYGEAHDYNVQINTGGGLWVYFNEYYTDCPGTPVEITTNIDGGTLPYSYLWSTGDTTESILVAPETTTGYKIWVTDNDGFIGTDTVYVYVNQKPDVSANGPFQICEGGDIQLTGSGTAFGTMKEFCSTGCDMPSGYCSSEALYSDNSIIEEVVLNTIDNNTAGNCATYSDFTDISTILVRNTMYDIYVTIGTCGADNYKGGKMFIDWNRDGDFGDSFEEVTEFWAVDTTYTHNFSIWVPDDAVLGNTRMRIVAIETQDTWNISSCGTYNYGETEDYTINIADTTQNQIVSFDWTGPNGFTSDLQNPLVENVIPADSGYYALTVTDGNSCINSDSIFIWVEANVFADAGNDTTICEYEIFKPRPVLENYMNVNWSTNGTGYFDTTYVESPSYYASWDDVQSGSVELTLTAMANYPCTDSVVSSLTLSFQQMPFAEVPFGDTICSNESYQINGVTATNYSSVLWTTTGTGTFSDNSILNPVFYPSQNDIDTGFVYLKLNLFGITPCSSDSFFVFVTIQKEPFAYAGEDTTICSDGTISLFNAFAADYDSIRWFTTGTGFFTDANTINPEYFPDTSDISAGTIVLSLVAYAKTPCTDSVVSSFTLSIIEETFANAGESGIICNNGSFALSEATASNYTSLLWETSGTGYFSDPSILNPVYYPGTGEQGTVTLMLTAFATSPCGNTSDPVYLDIMPAPVAYAGEDTTIMEGESYLLSQASASDYSMVEWSTNGTGYFDDPYLLNPAYFPASGETGDIELVLTAFGYWPCDSVTSSMTLSIFGGYDLDITVFLEGPFNGTDMNTNLNSVLPLSQPYGNSPWNYNGSESTALIPDPNIVDWILIELRDAPSADLASSGTMITRQAAFLRKNGQVVGVDGSSLIHFEQSITESLFVVVWHRNHVGIISANALNRTGNVYSYDFSLSEMQVLGGNIGYKQIVSGTWGMAGGDADANGTVENADKTIWLQNAGTAGYNASDYNMDIQINNNDKNDIWFKSIGKDSRIPD